jgi:uncharacterized protein (DUF1330 family)
MSVKGGYRSDQRRLAMSKGYWIVRVTVRDQRHYPQYLAAARAAFNKYEAKFLVRGGKFATMEGDSRERNIVVEFKDRATALACYRSPEYETAKAIRQKYAETDFIVIEGADASAQVGVAQEQDSWLLQGTAKPPGILRRIYDAFGRARQRHAELHLGRSLSVSGGCLTDDLERRLMQKTIQNSWF